MEDKNTLYARWLEGKISQEELDALRQSGELEALEKLIHATDSLDTQTMDEEAAYARFRQQYPPKQVAKSRSLPIRWLASIAASLLLLIVAYLFLRPPSTTQVFASNGQNEQIQLPAGSTVLLNDGSQIDYQPADWSSNRNIKLTGEAFFDVEKGVPFIVSTDNGAIRVLGTRFNVRTWGQRLEVACYEGRVRVSHQGEDVVLEAKESVQMIDGKLQAKDSMNLEEPLWSKGVSRFEEEDLGAVFKELERQFDIQVKHSVSQRSFKGEFKHQNLEAALKAICLPMGLDYSISPDQKEVTISYTE
ncbi:MAG: FecR domain-containing protein [Bacteroidota bacterium]